MLGRIQVSPCPTGGPRRAPASLSPNKIVSLSHIHALAVANQLVTQSRSRSDLPAAHVWTYRWRRAPQPATPSRPLLARRAARTCRARAHTHNDQRLSHTSACRPPYAHALLLLTAIDHNQARTSHEAPLALRRGMRRAPASAWRAGRGGRRRSGPRGRMRSSGTMSSSRAPAGPARTAACSGWARGRTCRRTP